MFIKIVIIVIISLLCSVIQAQQSFAQKFNLPQYDCEQKAFMDTKKLTIIVPDDSTVVWVRAKWLKEFSTERGVEVTIKTESKLQKSDLEDNLLVMGPISSYSHWKRLGIPIKKLRRGFKISKISFKNSSQGFSYTSPSGITPVRLAISGNSIVAFEGVVKMPSFGFEYVVLNDAIPEFIGNGSHFSNLNKLKKSLYTPIESKYYVFMVLGYYYCWSSFAFTCTVAQKILFETDFPRANDGTKLWLES